MLHVSCPKCHMSLHVEDSVGGTVICCPDCSEPVMVPATGPSPGASRWTVPVERGKWPASRWLTQIISGLVVVVMFGFFFVFLVHWAATVFFGLPFGLSLAGMLNGFLVGRRGRRYTARAVFAIMFGVVGIGLLVQPGLGLLLQAATFRLSGDVEKLRSVQRDLEGRPGDFRCLPARWTSEAGLRRFYADALHQLESEPSAGPPEEKELRGAFRQLVEDLSVRGSSQIVIDLQEELVPDEPPVAAITLLLWKGDPDFHWSNWLDKKDERYQNPVEDFRNALPEPQRSARVAALASALAKTLQPTLPSHLAQWTAADKADSSPHPRVEFHGRFTHTGQFIKLTTTLTRDFRLVGRSCRLYVVPAAAWEIHLRDSQGQLLGQAKLPAISLDEGNWNSGADDWRLGPYGEVLMRLYDRTAEEFGRRVGVLPAAKPKK